MGGTSDEADRFGYERSVFLIAGLDDLRCQKNMSHVPTYIARVDNVAASDGSRTSPQSLRRRRRVYAGLNSRFRAPSYNSRR